jgi:hypothetical protein
MQLVPEVVCYEFNREDLDVYMWREMLGRNEGAS